MGIPAALTVAVLFGVGFAIVARLRAAARQTVDSPAFNAGLKIWTDFVARNHDTPRAIKRWGNRLRYFAMLQQAPSADETAGGDLFAQVRSYWPFRQSKVGEKTPIKPADFALDERQLIMLGAAQEVYGSEWKEMFTDSQSAPRSDVDKAFWDCVMQHRRQFSIGWPPSKQELTAFQRLLSGIRVEAQPEPLVPPALPMIDPALRRQRTPRAKSAPSSRLA